VLSAILDLKTCRHGGPTGGRGKVGDAEAVQAAELEAAADNSGRGY
jgi:hypothetical protein